MDEGVGEIQGVDSKDNHQQNEETLVVTGLWLVGEIPARYYSKKIRSMYRSYE